MQLTELKIKLHRMSKRITILALAILASVMATRAQSEIESINKTVYEYIQGTANGEPERVRDAFQPGFQLFLISSDTLRIIDGKQYIANIEKGRKYHRIGRVVSIDHENNAATAKVEVFFPDTNRLATDYLILLKTYEGWKIVHKIINVSTKDIEDLNAFPVENEIENIEKTINSYFEGTSKSKRELLENIFWENLNLYSVKDENLNIMPRDKYLEYFSKNKTFNRIGKIIDIDFEKDAALVKLEIKMPDRNRVAIDYMLLLKLNGNWKVIHKAFTDKKLNLTLN